MAKILVTGGTGTLGRALVGLLRQAGWQPLVLTSKIKSNYDNEVFGDLISGQGLAAAVGLAEIIIHCASDFVNFEAVDVAGTARLLAALPDNGLQKLVYISIVGVDGSQKPYYRAKLAAERQIMAAGIPYKIWRISQFHDFVVSFIKRFIDYDSQRIELPAGLRFQSIDVTDAAQVVVADLFTDSGLMDEVAGPQVLTLPDMTATYCQAVGLADFVPEEVVMHNPEFLDFATGRNLSDKALRTGLTWDQYLARQYPAKNYERR